MAERGRLAASSPEMGIKESGAGHSIITPISISCLVDGLFSGCFFPSLRLTQPPTGNETVAFSRHYVAGLLAQLGERRLRGCEIEQHQSLVALFLPPFILPRIVFHQLRTFLLTFRRALKGWPTMDCLDILFWAFISFFISFFTSGFLRLSCFYNAWAAFGGVHAGIICPSFFTSSGCILTA
ncbi:hypothetical protein QBC46DRAFT_115825 [Diplogelasinospora grovesii]|uniref:Uncharacterized protein n=1 Tax=Diplogelasinospora grovesii TaxID=303347 RepID=A0AAN6NGD5_9PEZI|nr:hypothetical protein QBC46DRAFT_115825 [Diplogelasinospora grovesii]